MTLPCPKGTALSSACHRALQTSTKTLLEEPRAELTALHTMRLLLEAGMITEVLIL